VETPTPSLSKYSGKLRFCIFKDLIDWIYQKATDVEGIFRVSGEHTPVKELRELFDYENEIELLDEDDPHVISGALKLYLREAENPLITRELFNDFLEVAEINDQEATEKLKISCNKLPQEHKWILIYLCWLLNEIRKKEQVNLMSLQNIVIVFGPSIMKNPDPSGAMDFNIISQQSKVLTHILEHFSEIFGEKAVEEVLIQFEEYQKNNPEPPEPVVVVEEIENNNNTEPDPEPKNLQDSTPSFSVVDYDQNNTETDKKKKKN